MKHNQTMGGGSKTNNFKKTPILLLIFLFSLLFIRLILPYYLLRYVEYQINKIPQYKVKINDLDLHLWRGAYTIKGIQLWKIKKNIPVPFYEAKRMDFAIEWRSLLHGKLVARILVQNPGLNFVIDPYNKNEQFSINKQWMEVVKNLYPANINRLEASDGEVSLSSFSGKNPFKIYITNFSFIIDNMQKAMDKRKLLSSSFVFRGQPIGGGSIEIQGDFSPLAKEPTFKMYVKLNGLQVTSIGNFLKYYTSVDTTGGVFSLYGEAAAASGKIKGYVKPFIKNLKIGNPKDNNIISKVINGAAKVMSKVLENSRKKTIATQIHISGTIEDPNRSLLSIIGYLIRHAFIQAILPQIDHSITMQDILMGDRKRK